MDTDNLKSYLPGLGIYAVCIGLAALPIFMPTLGLAAALQLCAAAAVAYALTAMIRYSGMDAMLGDQGAYFIQAFLGIVTCSGVYSLVARAPKPEIVFMSFLLWTAVGLLHLTPRRVAALYVVNLGIYLSVFSSSMIVAVGTAAQKDTTFMLLVTTVMGGFMFWRARAYAQVQADKAQLHDAHAEQAVKLKDVETRLHAITTQDIDTIALKYPYFKRALMQEKARADRMNCTFSIGLIEIDQYAELVERLGELPAKQVLREFADRATLLIRRMDFLTATDPDYHPLGRIGDGLFGVILPMTGLEGAMRCAERLHTNVELDPFPTMQGMVRITLSIGLTEYSKGENVDDLIALAGSALQGAAANDIKGVKYPGEQAEPIRAARSSHDLKLLDYKDYGRQMH